MRNFYGYSFYLSLTTLLMLGLLWFVPGYKDDTVSIRRLNIISDVFSNSEMHDFYGTNQVEYFRMFEPEILSCTPYFYVAHMVEGVGDSVVNEVPDLVGQASEVDGEGSKSPVMEKTTATIDREISSSDVGSVSDIIPSMSKVSSVAGNSSAMSANGVMIEMGGEPRFRQFISALRSGGRVRIAVLGDSFIEGDIFTQDLREQLQKQYGGGGVGYVPITSQVAGFRRTVGHTFSGWNTQCVLSNPTSSEYHLAGYVFTPTEGAWVHYKGANFKSGLSSFKSASLMFINKGKTKITAVINDTITETFSPESSEQMQRISVTASPITSVRFKIANVAGFKCYGATLDQSGGVSVDNYSIRSYAGAGLSHISPVTASQMDRLLHYDLIILQYGLNVAAATTTRYTKYSQQMVTAISHLKRIMPQSAIMVMSVSDRIDRSSNKTMAGIKAMEQTQKDIAQQCAVPFWSTLQAMQKEGGMSYFVKKGWAAKDFTHLSSSGGKVIATKMVEALNAQ